MIKNAFFFSKKGQQKRQLCVVVCNTSAKPIGASSLEL